MKARLVWILKTTLLVIIFGGAIGAGLRLEQFGKTLFNAAML